MKTEKLTNERQNNSATVWQKQKTVNREKIEQQLYSLKFISWSLLNIETFFEAWKIGKKVFTTSKTPCLKQEGTTQFENTNV